MDDAIIETIRVSNLLMRILNVSSYLHFLCLSYAQLYGISHWECCGEPSAACKFKRLHRMRWQRKEHMERECPEKEKRNNNAAT